MYMDATFVHIIIMRRIRCPKTSPYWCKVGVQPQTCPSSRSDALYKCDCNTGYPTATFIVPKFVVTPSSAYSHPTRFDLPKDVYAFLPAFFAAALALVICFFHP